MKIIKNNEKPIVIFDIDNTIANSWPSFLERNGSERERLRKLPYFKNVVELAKQYQETSCVIFLTVRPYKYYFVTKNWLLSSDLEPKNLFMIDKPKEKIKYIKEIEQPLIIFDDMSYNHENGKIEYYQDEINQLKSMTNVSYYDYSYLLKIQS